MVRVRTGTITFGLIICILLLCLCSTTSNAPAQEAALPNNPPFDPTTRPITDFCRLYVEDGLLQARMQIPRDWKNGQVIQSGDFVLVTAGGNTATGLVRFQSRSISLPDGSSATDLLIVRTGPPMVELERIIRGPRNSVQNILLMQTLTNGGTFTMRFPSSAVAPLGRPAVPPEATPPINSPSFAEFVKDNPAEVEQYLRPILKTFGSEKLLYPFDMAVSQLFPELFKPDDAKKSAVKDLVGKLDSDSPDDREAASTKLKVMGSIALVALAEINPQSLSPEQCARVAVLMKDRLTDQQVAELSTDKDFLIDYLKDSRRPVRAAALRKLAGDKIEFDLDAESSQRAEAAEELRGKLFSEGQQ